MNKTRVIEKDSERIYSIFADAKVEERAVVAIYHIESKKWFVEILAILAKFGTFTFEDYKNNESIEVPIEVIEEMKRKQKEFDEILEKV
jgi:hypothetical protein